jgi:putative sterol carrier protein
MMTTFPLLAAAEAFVAVYHADAKLCADQTDWDCVVRLQASDESQHITLDVLNGRVRALSAETDTADLIVTAPLQILLDILQLKVNPNQPYIFGELTVAGQEADFMRVDYVASVLCAHG